MCSFFILKCIFFNFYEIKQVRLTNMCKKVFGFSYVRVTTRNA